MNTSFPSCFSLLLLVMALPATAQNFIDILPGGHSSPITSVTYEVDGNTVVQNSSASGVSVNRDNPVYLKSVTIQDGSGTRSLDSFNSLGAAVVNVGFTTLTQGVGVFDNGLITNTSNLAGYSAALAGTTQDTDLLNYSFYDGVSNMPPSGTTDYDLLFQRGFEPTDFVLVSERWGNTFFTLAPLGIDGELIAGANTLRFGYPTGSAYTKYDWNSGYAAASYQNAQAMAFSVASVSKFFEGTSTTPQNVFGFRIDNDGEADVKFFGLSDNSFANNPINTHAAIPEPSTAFLGAMAFLGLVMRRRR